MFKWFQTNREVVHFIVGALVSACVAYAHLSPASTTAIQSTTSTLVDAALDTAGVKTGS